MMVAVVICNSLLRQILLNDLYSTRLSLPLYDLGFGSYPNPLTPSSVSKLALFLSLPACCYSSILNCYSIFSENVQYYIRIYPC
jgi:hypothetical protein